MEEKGEVNGVLLGGLIQDETENWGGGGERCRGECCVNVDTQMHHEHTRWGNRTENHLGKHDKL
jgi:hypothetical protein